MRGSLGEPGHGGANVVDDVLEFVDDHVNALEARGLLCGYEMSFFRTGITMISVEGCLHGQKRFDFIEDLK